MYYESIYIAKLLWIHYLFREFTRDPLIFRIFTLNLLFLSRIHSRFIIFLANSLSIHYLFREFSMDPLIFSRIHFEFTISFAYSPIRYTICFAIDPFFFANSLFIYFLFARSLWILDLFCEFTIYFCTLYDEIIMW